MTTTLQPLETSPTAATQPGLHELRAALHDAVLACAQEDPEKFDSGTADGRAVLALAAGARSAAAALGVDPGTTLTRGPGVVVVRDLVAAVRLLDTATAGVSPRGRRS
jgi:hypothetical protein